VTKLLFSAIESLQVRYLSARPLARAQRIESRTAHACIHDEEVRIAIEERASLSPDALSGMEANLRFGPNETMETRVFGRLSAWQNWIFNRPNAVGEHGALKLFGSGSKAQFNWERV